MVSDPDYRIQNGDAAFLPLGTRVYRFGKSDPRLRVLVKRENGYRVYEAEHVRGTTGSEVLDLRVGITAVHLVDEHTGKKILRSITDDGNVARIRSALAPQPRSCGTRPSRAGMTSVATSSGWTCATARPSSVRGGPTSDSSGRP